MAYWTEKACSEPVGVGEVVGGPEAEGVPVELAVDDGVGVPEGDSAEAEAEPVCDDEELLEGLGVTLGATEEGSVAAGVQEEETDVDGVPERLTEGEGLAVGV
jgi:hypothetical protein